MIKKLFAEFIGTFWLVLGGCGSAVLAAGYPELGIGFVGVSIAFGLTVLTMAYAIGHVSGCHLNPAVTVGLAVARRTEKKDIVPYILSQVLGGLLGAYTLYLIASGVPSFDIINGFALNGVADFSPTGASLMSGIICEVVMTMMLFNHYLRSYFKESSQRIWTDSNRIRVDTDTFNKYSCDKYLCKSS